MVSSLFYLRARFISAPMITDAVHLDGLLWGALVRMGLSPDEALKHIPLERIETDEGGFFAGSVGIGVGGHPYPVATYPCAMICDTRDIQALVPDIKRPKPLMSRWPVSGMPEMVFIGRGDIDGVTELLPAITGIGKRVYQGLGEIDPETWLPRRLGNGAFPLVWPDGKPSRHLPWHWWIKQPNGNPSAPHGTLPLCPPYWSGSLSHQAEVTEAAFATTNYLQNESMNEFLKELR